MSSNLEESIKIWAEEYNIVLTEEQIESLVGSVEFSREMDMYSTGWTPGYKEETEDQKKIKTLNKQMQKSEYEHNQTIEKLHKEYGYIIDRLNRKIDDLVRRLG